MINRLMKIIAIKCSSQHRLSSARLSLRRAPVLGGIKMNVT